VYPFRSNDALYHVATGASAAAAAAAAGELSGSILALSHTEGFATASQHPNLSIILFFQQKPNEINRTLHVDHLPLSDGA
jgi:hypothetical protein